MNFLIIRLSSLGDIILTQPVIAELQTRFPDCRITYVCKPEYASVVRLMAPDIEILSYREELSFFDSLRRRSFDVALDLHGKVASNLIMFSTKAAQRYTYQKRRQLRQAIVAHKTDLSIPSTVGLYYSALNNLFAKHISPILNPKIEAPQLSADTVLLPELQPDEKLIAIFPGAAHQTKIYPEYLWHQFFEIAEPNWRFVMLGSKKEAPIAARLQKALPDRIENRCGDYSFEQLAWLISKCDLTISPDSGPMHLAAALSVPQIAIFGSTHPRLGFAPMNPKARILCADLDCQPCTLHGRLSCPLGHYDCMKKISPQMIRDAIDGMM